MVNNIFFSIGFSKQIPYPLEGPRINLIATKEFGKKNFI